MVRYLVRGASVVGSIFRACGTYSAPFLNWNPNRKHLTSSCRHTFWAAYPYFGRQNRPFYSTKSRPKSFSARFTISQISKQTRYTNCPSCLQQELSHPLRPSQEHHSGKSTPVFRQSHTKYSNVATFATTSPITAIWADREGLNPHHPFRTSTTGIDDAAFPAETRTNIALQDCGDHHSDSGTFDRVEDEDRESEAARGGEGVRLKKLRI